MPIDKTYAVFDRPANRKIISGLEEQGAKVFRINFPEIEAVELPDADLQKLQNPADFDWLVFLDVFAVEVFLQRLEESGIDFFELDAVRICAFGEAVSDRLRFVQIHSDVIPPDFQPENVFQAIGNFAVEIENLRFLILKKTESVCDLSNLLRAGKAEVSEIEIYRLKPDAELPKIKALLTGGAIDTFLFNSPEEVFAFANLFGAEKFEDLGFSSNDEITRQTLKEF
ncbi:MAG TPA: uroporphyrinogen-III synthase, partial [Pyrinomonadaceae bacterium]|nr:uroporphyrinogen-III synthase [Pyrinomonadaceae bacterium]